ncbi:MAG: hypothetical protein CMK63_10170 [Pseudoalteromonadaceae bacterium]|nr:hypothetical protein [Pseudoalteromonadaceae bacterium]
MIRLLFMFILICQGFYMNILLKLTLFITIFPLGIVWVEHFIDACRMKNHDHGYIFKCADIIQP